MMKKIINNEKGITLASLAIAVIVILILTSVIIYNVKDSLVVGNLKKMQTDIQNLRDKVSNYYSINNAIPAKLKYTNAENIEKIKQTGVISEEVDTGDFYIIDLKELENLTLNYGEDYKQITDDMTEDEASQYQDLYIINEASHNIFFVEGIRVDEDWFYTDYTNDAIDQEKVDLRYVEGVKIPDGFYYVGGTKQEGIVISDNIEDMGKGTSHEVAKTLQGNQFVWVPVENDSDFQRYAGYYDGQLQDISSYTEPYSNGYENEETEYNQMKQSVLKYNGFYVGRYEAGVEGTRTSGIADDVVIKQGKNVYNYIGWSNSDDMTVETGGAVQKSKEFVEENGYTSVTSTLMYGVQWDAIMQWIDPEYKNEDGTLYSKNSFVANSTDKGNYDGPVEIAGSSENYVVKNIYDLAGNVAEWTMETSGTNERVVRGGTSFTITIGGGPSADGSDLPSSNRDSTEASRLVNSFGFRVALYLNVEPFDEEKGVNAPQLGNGMELVRYDESKKDWVVDKSNSAYNYEEQTATTENGGTSQWANAKLTIDGVDSYFVWIPRYAYKINNTNNIIDVKFIKNTGTIAADGTPCKYADDPTLNIDTDYIIHPAFTTNADLGGGWDTELPGIWIAKYEASQSDAGTTEHDIGSSRVIQIKPNVTSWRYTTIGHIYTSAINYLPDLKSHMLKNSEWGAVAYLTHSKYGRNGTEVTINNNSNYLTGNAGDTIDASSSTTTNAYNTEKGALASSTGNVYGIYDLSGGASEYVAVYYGGSTSLSNGSTFTDGNNDEYSTVYDGTDVDTDYKLGDATKETKGWNGDFASFINSGIPFFQRGGLYFNSTGGGIFSFSSEIGYSYNGYYGFRISLVTE